jgi:hypothetical protein
MVGLRLTKEDKENNKLVRNHLKRGKITPKHLSVRWANREFDLSLKIKDNDIADSLAVCYCGFRIESNAHEVKASLPNGFFDENK